MKINLYKHQLDAVDKMHNGCILVGGVGTGKSRTALAYWYEKVCHGSYRTDTMTKSTDLYVITTAKKRDSFDWQDEAGLFLISSKPEASLGHVKFVVDSWNNITKYTNVKDSFFIFDEQRLVGSGTWVKSFYKIAKKNQWILLSATPADTWSDYIPVMVANGYYKNKTEFLRIHAVFNRFTNYPKIDKYINTGRLVSIRNKLVVKMPYMKQTKRHMIWRKTNYDKTLYFWVKQFRRNPFEVDEDGERIPIRDAGELCYIYRHIVNGDSSRIDAIYDIYKKRKRVIVFYNFDYELETLENFCKSKKLKYACYNGHIHEDVPTGDAWLYLVQYIAGAEAWECITSDTIIFFSLNYSYRVMVQSEGRIDRLNTPYDDLYYYFLVSDSGIDQAIRRSLKNKKRFNIAAFAAKDRVDT